MWEYPVRRSLCLYGAYSVHMVYIREYKATNPGAPHFISSEEQISALRFQGLTC